MRAKVVSAEELINHRWSSLSMLGREDRPSALCATDWLAIHGLADDATGRDTYVRRLIGLGRDEAAWERAGLTGLSRGWALGTAAWRRALANDRVAMKLTPGLARAEIREVNLAWWELTLVQALARSGRSRSDLKTRPKSLPWKIDLAGALRRDCGASIGSAPVCP